MITQAESILIAEAKVFLAGNDSVGYTLVAVDREGRAQYVRPGINTVGCCAVDPETSTSLREMVEGEYPGWLRK